MDALIALCFVAVMLCIAVVVIFFYAVSYTHLTLPTSLVV